MHYSKVSWPFHKWGIDILGPSPLVPRQLKFLVIAIDFFTKWIEVEPLPTIPTEKVGKFVWKRIICKYGVPHHLVSDNGTQFMDWRFEDLYRKLGITQLFSSVEHPQTIGLAEVSNKIIIVGLKKSLEQAPKAYGQMSYMLYYGLIMSYCIHQPRKHHID